jgi:phosphatidylglycerophosphatase A
MRSTRRLRRRAIMTTRMAIAEGDRAPLWATVVATWFGVGRLRPAPGTWGSLAAILIWLFLSRWIPPAWQAPALAALAAAAVVVGIPASTRVAQALAVRDPACVVVDEVAGQWIALLWVPVSWQTLLLGFILFRGFDILKPPPVRQLERLPAGTGIVLDDVGAGVCALGAIRLLLYLGLFPR